MPERRRYDRASFGEDSNGWSKRRRKQITYSLAGRVFCQCEGMSEYLKLTLGFHQLYRSQNIYASFLLARVCI
jgi:hypothetical protein